MTNHQIKYLQLLSRSFPTIQAASTEIINLNAILNLPKGTEHFLSDVHGEYEAFQHILKNASGSIRRRIHEIFGHTLSTKTQKNLATLIYYPREKLEITSQEMNGDDGALEEWYRITLLRLVKICRVTSSKYTRSKVRKALPEQYAYILEELLHEQESIPNKNEYYLSIIDTIVRTKQAPSFIFTIAEVIQRLAVDHLHVVGDIYDRGPGAHIIMDTLMDYHTVDVQWGNHDVLWMGAAAGSDACIANVLRISLRYANMETLEDGYGINLLPLATLALSAYGEDPCTQFAPKLGGATAVTDNEKSLMTKMHKAISIIQFKLEATLIQRNPDYNMAERLLLDKIDYEKGTIRLNGTEYPLNDRHFPTIDPKNPYTLNTEEEEVVNKLRHSFENSTRLQRHTRFLYSHGSLYLAFNGNLLYHGCIPMKEDGSFDTVDMQGNLLSLKQFFEQIETAVRAAYFAHDEPAQKQQGMDDIWYLWCGRYSPLFGKDKMATFERYFIDDKTTHKEVLNPYYAWRDDRDTALRILKEFGLNPTNARIVSGHIPVKVKKGETPIKAGGKMIVIDGGFAKAYQPQTGIAGYTLVYNSYGLLLAAHYPFESAETAIYDEADIDSKTEILETNYTRIRIKDTDLGRKIQGEIDDLYSLLAAYYNGTIAERE